MCATKPYINNRFTSSTLIIILLSLAIYSIRLIFLTMPDLRTWGVNHLEFLPDFQVIIYFCGLPIIGMLFVKQISIYTGNIYSLISNLFTGRKYLKWGILSIACIPIFWMMRTPTHFLGDGYTIINNIGNDLPVIYKWTEIGAIAFINFVYNIIPISGLEGATHAYAIASVVSGAITIFFFLGIANELSKNNLNRLFTFCILLFSGWTLLFLGYVENYPFLWALMTAYLYFSLRSINNKCSVVIPVVVLLIALTVHLQSIFYLPSLPILLIFKDPSRKFYHRFKVIILSVTVVLCITGIGLFLTNYFSSLSFRSHFLPLLNGHPPATYYALISWPHLIDILNLFSLIIPIWPILLFCGFKGFRFQKGAVKRIFLLSFSIGGIIMLLILDPKLGMGRDWDLFALCGLGPALLMIKATFASKSQLYRFHPVIVLLALFCTIPYFLTNIQKQPSIAYNESLIELDLPKSRSGMSILKGYYLNIGEDQKANDIDQKMLYLFPNASLIKQGNQFIQAGKTSQALNIAEKAIKNDPNKSGGYSLRGTAYLMMRQFDKALANYETALELEPYYAYNHMNLGQYYYYNKDFDQSIEYYHKALAIEPAAHSAYRGLGNSFYGSNRHDSGLVYFEKAIAINPDAANNYLMAGYCAYHIGLKNKTKTHLIQYLKRRPQALEIENIRKILDSIE